MKTIASASTSDIQQFLHDHQNWLLKEHKLHREFVFSDFAEAFGFMAQVALVAERSQHHPEWCNVYNKVSIDLCTHEVNNITERDFILAQKIDKISLPLIQIA